MIVGDRSKKMSSGPLDTGVNLNIRDPYTGNMSDSEIDALINTLCEVREDNPDVQIIDQVLSGEKQIITDPILAEKLSVENEEADIEKEILKDLFEKDNLSIEEVNMYKMNGLYNRYEKHIINKGDNIDMTTSIEEELKKSLESESQNDIPVIDNSEVEIVEDNSFRETTEECIDITDEVSESIDIEKIKKFNEQIKKFNEGVAECLKDPATEIKEYHGIVNSDEKTTLDDDVPASELHPEEEDVKSKIKESYNGIDDDDVTTILNVMKRYQSGEKFNVYQALPTVFRNEINKAAMEAGVTDKDTINFFAKNLINDIISDTYIGKEFNDFQTELEEATAPMNNMQGLIFDTYTDDLKVKFEDNMLELAEKIKEEEPDKSEKLIKMANNFKATYTLSKISDSIKEKPSLINRAYKDGRDSFEKIKDNFNEHFKDSKPRVKPFETIMLPLTQKLGYSDEYAKTLAVLINNSIMSEITDNDVESHIYAYFMVYGFLNINLTANSSELTKTLCESIFDIMQSIESYMTAVNSSKKNRKKKK